MHEQGLGLVPEPEISLAAEPQEQVTANESTQKTMSEAQLLILMLQLDEWAPKNLDKSKQIRKIYPLNLNQNAKNNITATAVCC